MTTERHRSAAYGAKAAGLCFEVAFADASSRDQERLLGELKLMLRERKLGHATVSVAPPRAEAAPARAEAELRGEARLVRWTQDGTLVPVSVLENHWGVRRQSVDAARRRGEVFSVFVRGQHWYPAEALKFDRATLADIVKALGDEGASSKLLFLLRQHGALRNRTPAEAIECGMLDDVLRVANAQAAI
jgi:hypothetical protein